MSQCVLTAAYVWIGLSITTLVYAKVTLNIKHELLRAALWPIFLLCIPVAYAIYCVRWLVRWMEAV